MSSMPLTMEYWFLLQSMMWMIFIHDGVFQVFFK
jgi:hypothetical protein